MTARHGGRRDVPALARWILRLAWPADEVPGILGDLIEEYDCRSDQPGARRWLWWQVLRSVPPLLGRRLYRVGRAVRAALGDSARGGLESIGADVSYALRQMRSHAVFSGVALLTLAIGIGANTAIFSVVHGVLLRPLPFEDSDRIDVVWETIQQYSKAAPSPANFEAWKERSTSFEDLAAIQSYPVSIAGQDRAERATLGHVTANMFDVLGVSPALGRGFVPSDDEPGAPPVVVLAHGFWDRRFGADRSAIGTSMLIDAVPHTIVGVMPERFGFEFPEKQELWRPGITSIRTAQPDTVSYRWHWVRVVGRRFADVSLARAQSEMDAIAAALAQEFPESNEGWGVNLVPIREQLVGNLQSTLVLLLWAVALVLLVACANVSNLLLVRASARGREIAIRRATGASTPRLVRQLFTEAALLAVLGGALGVGLAAAINVGLTSWVPADIPGIANAELDGSVLLFTAFVVVATTIGLGLVPALSAVRTDVRSGLRAGGSAGGGPRRTHSLLLAGESALVVLLLVGAGLLSRALMNLSDVELGFETGQKMVFDVALSGETYPDQPAVADFAARLQERLASLPGVERAALTTSLPFGLAGFNFGTWAEGVGAEGTEGRPAIRLEAVTPGLIESVGLPLRSGRAFTSDDDGRGERVAILNEHLSRIVFGEDDPLGRRVSVIAPLTGPWYTVVGVVADVRYHHLLDPEPRIYVPLAHIDWSVSNLQVVAGLRSGRGLTLSEVRTVVSGLDPGMAVANFRSLERLKAVQLARPRFRAALMGSFAGMAMLLGMIGIYAVVRYATESRRRDFAIRVALGAPQAGLVRLVVVNGLKPVVAGLAVGLLVASQLTRLLDSFLYGMSKSDPTTYVGTVAALFVAAVLACLIPALGATRTDPAEVLRSD